MRSPGTLESTRRCCQHSGEYDTCTRARWFARRGEKWELSQHAYPGALTTLWPAIRPQTNEWGSLTAPVQNDGRNAASLVTLHAENISTLARAQELSSRPAGSDRSALPAGRWCHSMRSASRQLTPRPGGKARSGCALETCAPLCKKLALSDQQRDRAPRDIVSSTMMSGAGHLRLQCFFQGTQA